MRIFLFLLAILFLAGALGAAAVTCPTDDGVSYDGSSGVCIPMGTGLPDPDGGIAIIIANLLIWLLIIFGMLGVISFVVSGILYLTAAGDADQEKKAKNAMKMSIIGVIVGLLGVILVQTIDMLLNAREF